MKSKIIVFAVILSILLSSCSERNNMAQNSDTDSGSTPTESVSINSSDIYSLTTEPISLETVSMKYTEEENIITSLLDETSNPNNNSIIDDKYYLYTSESPFSTYDSK